jgi:hypothetical protein
MVGESFFSVPAAVTPIV